MNCGEGLRDRPREHPHQRQEAILADLACALADQPDKSDRYVLTHGLGYLPPVLLVGA